MEDVTDNGKSNEDEEGYVNDSILHLTYITYAPDYEEEDSKYISNEDVVTDIQLGDEIPLNSQIKDKCKYIVNCY